jgi:hypothetical protein
MRALYVFTLYKTGQGFSNISKQHAGTLYLPSSNKPKPGCRASLMLS